MLTRNGNLHLEIQTSAKNPVGILRTATHSKGKTYHQQYGRIKANLSQLKLLQMAFREQLIPCNNPAAFKILESKEYGASSAILAMIKDIGLDINIYSRPYEQWVKNVMAMIAGRIIYQGSKLSLCNQYENSSLWQQAGIEGKPDVEEDCYFALDELLSRQNLIQKKLAKKHLQNGHLVLYDITSSYLEGEYKNSKLVKFGHNRDLKKGHKQVVIGLLCSKEGCPVGVEVYPGNTKDETTVIDKIKEIRYKYDIKKVIFVGDRGMVTSSNIEKLKDQKDVFTISALTRNEIFELLKNNTIQPSLFDEHNIYEVIDPQDSSKRYCLCKNPLSKDRDKATRNRLLELTEQSLKEISNYKQKTTIAILGSRIGKVLNKYKMGKFLDWNIQADHESRYGLYTMLKYKKDKVAKSVQEHDFVIVKSDKANRVFYLKQDNKVSELKREKHTQYKILTKIEEIKIVNNKKYQPDDFGLELNKLKDLVAHLGCVHKESKSKNHKVIWKVNKEAVQKAELLDGCYIISSNVSPSDIDTNEIVASYKKLELVETAFRNLKTVSLEMRPIHHKKDYRIEAHVFLCMLAYYVQWHMTQRLKPLFANDGKGKKRKWTFAEVVDTLKQVTRNKTTSQGIEFYQNSILTKNQKQIIDYLRIKI